MILSRMRGARVIRKEDPRLITGSATYVDDVRVPGTLHLVFVRSQYPHARIRGIDTQQAQQMPGVVAIYTGQDMQQIVKPSDRPAEEVEAPDLETDETEPEQFWMALGTVRTVGTAIVAVVAETEAQARDAAETIQVDYEPLQAVVDIDEAMKDGAPQLYPQFPNNICHRYDKSAGDTDAAFQNAPITVKERLINNRVAGVPMEGRAVLAMPDPMMNGLTFWTSTQAQFWNRRDVAEALSMPESNVRTIAPQVGGGFGVKIGSYPEDFILSAVAKDLDRPVKWVETRSENLSVTHQGRAQVAEIEVAAEQNGKIRGYRLRVFQDQGSYPKDTSLANSTGLMAVGCYDIPNVEVHVLGVLTNTTEIGAYRGAGRPEAAFYIERAIDLVADACKLDPTEVRRINFIQPDKFPYATPTGANYDSGDYEKTLEKALQVANYQQLRQEQAEARKQGRLLGIGVSSYVEICGFGPFDSAQVRVERDGAVSVYSGILPQGQGQETAFAQIVADELGVPFDDINVHFGDTATSPQGNGTMGSRGLVVGGGAVFNAAGEVREKAKRIAASLLEASPDDIELNGDQYQVKGTDRSVTMVDIAKRAYNQAGRLPKDIDAGLEATNFFRPGGTTFPFGTHVAVVEILPETGEIKIVRYLSVDDCGPRVNPLLVEGQVHGGLAQGISQALLEEVVFDSSGQLLTGTLMDYAIPKAHNFPMFETDSTETTSPHNPLGAKGIGEAATIGSTPAIANAVIDALEPFGITHLDMPFRSQTIWETINKARQSQGQQEQQAQGQQ